MMRRVGIWILTALAMIAVGVLLIYKSLSDGNFDFSEVTDMKLQTTISPVTPSTFRS